MNATMDETQLVAAVRAHALRYYEHGWDVLVECWSDGDILEVVSESQTAGWPTLAEALAKVADALGAEVKPATTGWDVVTRDVDGTGRKHFTSEAEAIARWEEMVGRPFNERLRERLDEHNWVSGMSDFGTSVTLRRLGGAA